MLQCVTVPAVAIPHTLAKTMPSFWRAILNILPFPYSYGWLTKDTHLVRIGLGVGHIFPQSCHIEHAPSGTHKLALPIERCACMEHLCTAEQRQQGAFPHGSTLAAFLDAHLVLNGANPCGHAPCAWDAWVSGRVNRQAACFYGLKARTHMGLYTPHQHFLSTGSCI